MEDNMIVSLLYARSEEGLEETARKYGPLLASVARGILPDEQDAEECVNDTYMKIWQVIPPYRPSCLRAFLCRIARQIAIDRLRALDRKKRGAAETSLFSELDEIADIPDGSLDDGGDLAGLPEAIDDFLARTDVKSRTFFIRRYFLCESVSSLAERYGTEKNNVSVTLFRTREKLKQYLINKGYRI